MGSIWWGFKSIAREVNIPKIAINSWLWLLWKENGKEYNSRRKVLLSKMETFCCKWIWVYRCRNDQKSRDALWRSNEECDAVLQEMEIRKWLQSFSWQGNTCNCSFQQHTAFFRASACVRCSLIVHSSLTVFRFLLH